MRKKVMVGLAVLVIFLSPQVSRASNKANKAQAPAMADRHGRDLPQYVEGELLIKFRENFTATDRKLFQEQVGAAVVTANEAKAAFHNHFGTQSAEQLYSGWERVRLPKGKQVKAAVAEYQENALVETAEPNGYVYASDLSTTYTAVGGINDTYYADGASQWWLNRTQGDDAIVRGFYFSNATQVVVAVLDTGVDTDHADLSGRLVTGWNYVSGSSDTDDDNEWIGTTHVRGHGTHVAGTIAAVVNNSSGVAGTAWDTRIKIMPVKVLDSSANGTFANIGSGIDYARTNGADIINMSLETTTDSSYISTAVTSANTAGILMIAAAGNSNYNLRSTPVYPGCYTSVFNVGALTSDDEVTWYSNYSDPSGLVDCVAPGGALLEYGTGWYPDGGITCTARGGGWSGVDGTSFSAPQVTGLAALLLLQNTSRTPTQIKTLITNGCEMVGTTYSDPMYIGSGKINVMNSLNVAPITPSATPIIVGTSTYTPTLTRTPTRTPIVTLTQTPTISPSRTRTATRTATRTVTRTATRTSTRTLTQTPTYSPTYTMTPTFTVTRTITRTATITLTSTISTTFTHSPTITPTPTITQTSTQVPLKLAQDELRAYPQPAKDVVRVAFAFHGPGTAELSLFNAVGEKVLQVNETPVERSGFGIIDVDLRSVSPGVYILYMKIEDADGSRVATSKTAVAK